MKAIDLKDLGRFFGRAVHVVTAAAEIISRIRPGDDRGEGIQLGALKNDLATLVAEGIGISRRLDELVAEEAADDAAFAELQGHVNSLKLSNTQLAQQMLRLEEAHRNTWTRQDNELAALRMRVNALEGARPLVGSIPSAEPADVPADFNPERPVGL